MSKSEDRVLTRVHARALTEQEVTQATGGFIISKCTFDPKTCAMDGVCSPPPAC
jgi:hypothetical protein